MTPHTNSHRFAAALSLVDDLPRALDEVCQAVRRDLNAEPDLAAVFFTADWTPQAESIAGTLQTKLAAKTLIGCSGESVIGPGREIEGQPAVALWAASLPGTEILPMHLQVQQTPEGACVVGWHEQLAVDWPPAASLLLLGDPFTFPADVMLERLNEDQAGMPIVGGMASAASSPGENRLILNDRVHSEGAVAVLLAGQRTLRTVVSQGCRPIGQHYVVTRSDKNVIFELGGKPALLQLKEIFDTLPAREQELVQRGLHVGRVVSEYQDRFEQGDFLVRNVMGIDPNDGAIAIADWVRTGQTVQFHIRDHETADAELRQMLQAAGQTEVPQAALLFSCNGRGTRLFPGPDHDASAIHNAWGKIPTAGFFAAGEIGPVSGKNFVHGFTASLALFD